MLLYYGILARMDNRNVGQTVKDSRVNESIKTGISIDAFSCFRNPKCFREDWRFAAGVGVFCFYYYFQLGGRISGLYYTD
jgi:hypothetical protein